MPGTSIGASLPELNNASGGPPSYFNNAASHYVFGEIPLDKNFIEMLSTLSGDEANLTEFLRKFKARPRLGNALMLTDELYDRWKTGKKLPDFNLDADRGYAYTCWTQKENSREEPKELEVDPVKLDFIQS